MAAIQPGVTEKRGKMPMQLGWDCRFVPKNFKNGISGLFNPFSNKLFGPGQLLGSPKFISADLGGHSLPAARSWLEKKEANLKVGSVTGCAWVLIPRKVKLSKQQRSSSEPGWLIVPLCPCSTQSLRGEVARL